MDPRHRATLVARAPVTTIKGQFERHVSRRWALKAFEGSTSGGRWSLPGSFPVIYLGRPRDSVVVEAYRHLVDPVEGMSASRVRGRFCLRAEVEATDILDLRGDHALDLVGLTVADVTSDVGDYEECQAVGHIAHQMGYHGLIAPSASSLGDTLALFPRHLPPAELPVPVGEPEEWQALPADPRRLRLVRDHPA